MDRELINLVYEFKSGTYTPERVITAISVNCFTISTEVVLNDFQTQVKNNRKIPTSRPTVSSACNKPKFERIFMEFRNQEDFKQHSIILNHILRNHICASGGRIIQENTLSS